MSALIRFDRLAWILTAGLAAVTGGPARAQVCAPASAVLDAYRTAASSGWHRAKTLELRYRYSGQDMTGRQTSHIDTATGAIVDRYDIGPTAGATGFDGRTAWQRHPSGIVVPEGGGDSPRLAVDEAYRNANLWWRNGRGGAAIETEGCRKADGHEYAILAITPRGGERFEAWFDAASHRLSRVVERQGFKTVTTHYRRYRWTAGTLLPHTVMLDDGSGAADRQILTLTSARWLPPRPVSAYGPPNNRLHDYSIDDGAASTTLPFELLNNHIVASVWIDGHGPFRFLIDTGGFAIVTPALASQLRLRSAGQVEANGTGTSAAHGGYARVGDIRLGRAHIQHQTAVVLRFEPDAVEGFRVDGILGFGTFWRFIVRIDYGRRTLTLYDPARFHPPKGATVVPFVFHDTVPEVRGSFDGIPGTFDIDTGSRSELDLTAPFVTANRLRERNSHGVMAVTGWGIGGPSRAYVTRARSLELGTVRIPRLVANLSTQARGSFADPSYAGNVGSGLLKRFTLTLDYRNRTLYFEPRATPSIDAGTYDRSGMWINQAGAGLQVADVTQGGPAQAAGIEPGDLIVGIDGAPSSSVTLSNLRQRLRDAPAGTRVTFTIRRHDRSETHGMTLKDQIPAP